jgi:Response regulator containing a CheY-like receiver domain and an HTH DNA-binding domain
VRRHRVERISRSSSSFIRSEDDDEKAERDHEEMDEPTDQESAKRPGVDLSSLSDRERDVLVVALTGASAAAIAQELSLTEATVRSHLAHIYAKLEVAGRVELLARMNGVPLPNAAAGQGTQEPEPRRHGWTRLHVGLLAAVIAAVAFAAFAVVRPDLPPPTNLASVSQLAADRHVTALDLRGDTLFVTTTDGRRFRVDGVSAQAVDPIEAAVFGQGVDASRGGDTLATTVLMIASGILPAALAVLAVALVLRWRRRPPEITPGPASA